MSELVEQPEVISNWSEEEAWEEVVEVLESQHCSMARARYGTASM